MTFPKHAHTSSAEETERLGAELALGFLEDDKLPPFVALFGDLGVGKTAFVRGFTREISPSARVKSPTFTLVNEYRGQKTSVFHFDMYRIEDEDELYSIGFYDYLDKCGICLTEWSENIVSSLPYSYVKVNIKKDGPANSDSRSIHIELVGV